MKFFLASLLMAGAIHADGIRAAADAAADGPVLRTSGPTSSEEHAADDEGKTEGYADLVTKPGSIGSGSIGECVFSRPPSPSSFTPLDSIGNDGSGGIGTKRAQAQAAAGLLEFNKRESCPRRHVKKSEPARPAEQCCDLFQLSFFLSRR